ncbi:MAG TPA: MarR family winged helix-turn-helix transcriptional regulator [Acidobacteriaceae bacterium]|jgi:DNA-binding MarR family transcriptional regulator|nr:MarR family winged helix-turn-helix transcriptional regulator [Acidobacteriaceae bacterium]
MNFSESPGVASIATSRHTYPASKEPAPLTRAQMRRLAEFRFQLRKFLHFSSLAAGAAGIRSQQYQLLQCIWGMPEELDPTIANVAARMLLKHNSAVELVDRTIEQGLLRRCPDPTDHRRILLRMTPLGDKLLGSLAAWHLRELEETGPELIRALRRVLLTPQQQQLANGANGHQEKETSREKTAARHA